MKNRLYITLLLFLVIGTGLKAQDTANAYKFNKLEPIVQVFGTASYNFEDNNYGYSFGRAHLGFQYRFNEKWNAKIIIDRGRATSVGEITVTGADGNMLTVQNISKEGAYYTMFLKFASLQWKINDKLSFEGGAILQNHYITQERFWGLRYVAQTFQDLYWHIPSSDLGFIAAYKFNNVFSVDVAITNGEGPRKVQDAFGKTKLAFGLDVNPSTKFQTRIYYHIRHSGQDNLETEQLISVFAGFNPNEKFRIGGEFNYIDNLNNNSLNSYGFSVYSICQITSKTKLFTRFDRLLFKVPNNTTSNINNDGNTLIGGISHSPVKGVNLSLNYQGWLPDDETNIQNKILLNMEYKF